MQQPEIDYKRIKNINKKIHKWGAEILDGPEMKTLKHLSFFLPPPQKKIIYSTLPHYIRGLTSKNVFSVSSQKHKVDTE